MYGRVAAEDTQMGRVKNLKLFYSEQPANCPMCGKHTVVTVMPEEQQKLAQTDDQGNRHVPSWMCESCGTLLFKQTE